MNRSAIPTIKERLAAISRDDVDKVGGQCKVSIVAAGEGYGGVGLGEQACNGINLTFVQIGLRRSIRNVDTIQNAGGLTRVAFLCGD